MFCKLRQKYRAWSDTINFISIDQTEKPIVFFSENRSYRNYLEPVIRCLTVNLNRMVKYVTSDFEDPWLQSPLSNMAAFYVGTGLSRAKFFESLDCGLFVSTTPDLDNFHIKRSGNRVHYIYLHHSIVSTHMIYRDGAFDHFDSILCVGPHHEKEVRQWEQLKGLPQKRIFQHGYGPLDLLIEQKNEIKGPFLTENGAKRILLAPSWGANGILESGGGELIEAILGSDFHLTVRPHPQTRLLSPAILDELTSSFSDRPNFQWEEDIRSHESFHAAHVMISDWSGAALEFALGLERPVLFLDVPRKVNNPEYDKIEAIPLEVSIRSEIGKVVAPNDPGAALQALNELCSNIEIYCDCARVARSNWIYNVGKSGEVGARIISELDDECRSSED